MSHSHQTLNAKMKEQPESGEIEGRERGATISRHPLSPIILIIGVIGYFGFFPV